MSRVTHSHSDVCFLSLPHKLPERRNYCRSAALRTETRSNRTPLQARRLATGALIDGPGVQCCVITVYDTHTHTYEDEEERETKRWTGSRCNQSTDDASVGAALVQRTQRSHSGGGRAGQQVSSRRAPACGSLSP
ncbi:unnamed protein product [Arctogadus glacialis]